VIDFDYIKGSKKVLFFLHGWGGDKNSFSMVKNHITVDCSMVFVSFSGFGLSPQPHRAFYVDDYVEELMDLVLNLNIKSKITFVCHSFGARVAIKFFNKYPDFVESLFIVDGAGIKPRRGLKYYTKINKYKRIKKQVLKGKKDKKELDKYGSADYKSLSGVMRQTLINVVNEDLKKYIKNINVDTLLFWGKNDKDTPLYMAKKMKKWIRKSELILVKNAAHFSYLDNYAFFIRVLNAFLYNWYEELLNWVDFYIQFIIKY